MEPCGVLLCAADRSVMRQGRPVLLHDHLKVTHGWACRAGLALGRTSAGKDRSCLENSYQGEDGSLGFGPDLLASFIAQQRVWRLHRIMTLTQTTPPRSFKSCHAHGQEPSSQHAQAIPSHRATNTNTALARVSPPHREKDASARLHRDATSLVIARQSATLH